MKKFISFLILILFCLSFANNAFAVRKPPISPGIIIQGAKNYYLGHIHPLLLNIWMENDLPTPGTMFNHLYNNYPQALEQILDWQIDPSLNFKTDEEKISFHLDCVVLVKRPDGGFGSGFFIQDDYLITNHHVVEEIKKVQVKKFESESLVNATVIAKDKNNDIALLKSKGNSNNCIINNYKSPKILSEVIAIGHPEGLEFSVTQGVINAYRDIKANAINDINSKKIHNIQMDAAIHPGSSGGPLFHNGLVIGMNTMGLKGTSLNFAIHTNTICNFLSKQSKTKTLCTDNHQIIYDLEQKSPNAFYFYIIVFLFFLVLVIIYLIIKKLTQHKAEEKDEELERAKETFAKEFFDHDDDEDKKRK